MADAAAGWMEDDDATLTAGMHASDWTLLAPKICDAGSSSPSSVTKTSRRGSGRGAKRIFRPRPSELDWAETEVMSSEDDAEDEEEWDETDDAVADADADSLLEGGRAR